MKLLTELYDYQRQAVDKLSHVKVGALYMEMGTGKTRTALELINLRLITGKIEKVLWLCPYSVQRDLPELLSEHCEGFMDICRICGIESLSSSYRLKAELLEYVMSAHTYLIVDESLLVKNPFAYRTCNVMEISQKCTYKLILNGTAISRNEADLFAQWYILDWRILGYKSYYSFSANHLEMDADHPGRVKRVLNVEYLTRKIAPYTFECRKEDVLKLPDKIYHKAPFRMTDEQDEHYAEISDILLLQVNELRPETIYRTFGALQAIASGFFVKLNESETHGSLLRMYEPLDNPRIRALLNVLKKIGDEQAVIYCKYTQEIEDIIEVLGDSALPFYGDISQKERQKNKQIFKCGAVQYLVANKSCAKFGLNLQFCHNEIFYNNDWDWSTRVQAEDRLHRPGQKKDVQIWDIYASGTIDQSILSCLSRKERLADLFRNEIASHNNTSNFLRAAAHGLLEEEHGENI